jgi:tetratricopeptide (TPR) repeat protein
MAGRDEGPRPDDRDPTSPLAGLTPDQQRILAYASAIGPEFDFSLLVAAMGVDEEPLSEQVERLVHLGLFQERPGGERFAFSEEGFRGRTYRSLTESRLRVLHRKIAEVLEKMYPDPPPSVLEELGRHFFLGKVPEKSYRYNRRAAEAARSSGEPESAAHHYERVLVDLSTLPGDRRREQAEVAEALGDLYYSMGKFTEADRSYGEALERLGTDEPRIRASLLLARAEIARENLDEPGAQRGALAAQELFEKVRDRLGVAQTFRVLGRLDFQRGAYRDALDENMRALEELGPVRDLRFLGRLSIDIGNSFALLGPEVRPIAIEWYERAVERLREVGDWVELARAYHNMGVALGETRPQDGLDFLERARDAGERAHDPRSVGRALLSGVEMRLALGDIEEAERDNEQAGRLMERLGDALGNETVALNRGQIAERQGQWDDAAVAYAQAIEACHRFNLPANEAEAEFYLARLRFKTRDLDGARQAFRRAAFLGLPQARPQLAPAFEELGRQLDEPTTGPPGGLTDDLPATADGASDGRPL